MEVPRLTGGHGARKRRRQVVIQLANFAYMLDRCHPLGRVTQVVETIVASIEATSEGATAG